MKPSFALNLTHDGISLLHRVSGGWRMVDEVRLDDAELSDKLKVMRRTATTLESGRMATKLVIPNSQILYTSVTAPGPSNAERFDQIRSALEGLTPYSVDDLMFDWDASGDICAVAAVAKVTLDEAEAFALEHKFNPVSFVAIPEGGTFRGEPFFGLAGAADTVLEGAEVVDRDRHAIILLGAGAPPAPAEPMDQTAIVDDPPSPDVETPDATVAEEAASSLVLQPTFSSTFQNRGGGTALASVTVGEKAAEAPSRISFVPVEAATKAQPAPQGPKYRNPSQKSWKSLPPRCLQMAHRASARQTRIRCHRRRSTRRLFNRNCRNQLPATRLL